MPNLQKHKTIAIAESCTGGLLGHLITQTPGCSDYFLGGVISYDNRIKRSLLGVSQSTLKRFGAVSPQAAREMAQGVCKRFRADIGIGITGIAGPDGGSQEKPIGLVYIALASGKKTTVKKFRFRGGRSRVKQQAAEKALRFLGFA